MCGTEVLASVKDVHLTSLHEETNNLDVCTYLIFQGIKAFEDKLKHGFQVLGTRGRHKYVGVPNRGWNFSHVSRCHENFFRSTAHHCCCFNWEYTQVSPKCHSASHGQAQGSRLATPPGCSHSNSTAQGLLRYCFYELQHSLTLW